jgi:hypothetical protein
MKWLLRYSLLGVLTVSASVLAGDIKDIRVPLDRYENGKLKSQLVAASADMPLDGDGGVILAKGVKVEFFNPDGTVDIVITAEDCAYDRQARSAQSKTHVRVVRKDIEITGTGFEWKDEDQVVRVLSDAKVVFDRQFRVPMAGPASATKGKDGAP